MRQARELPAPAGYSGTPLPKKLGIKPDMQVALLGAPDDFRKTLGELPGGAALCDGDAREAKLTIWFVRSASELNRGMVKAARCAQRGPVWIASPKKTSGVVCDFSQNDVRDAGLAAGLVDYKVCAIDATWSGLLFAKRKKA